MCMVVYIASDFPLPLIPWSDCSPAFHVTELIDQDQLVRRQFSKPHVYYVGSHHKCGCGFQYGDNLPVTDEEKQEDSDSRACVSALADYLSDVVRRGPVELFACWDGDQEAEPESRTELTPDDFCDDEFAFVEKELLTIVAE